jgi:hypothetical protein
MLFVITPILVAATTDGLRHRLTSRLVEQWGEWWQMPAAMTAAAAIVGIVVWLSRRDTVEHGPLLRAVLVLLRLAAVAAILVAMLDIERISEHEVTLPSRVAVIVDSSASMAITDEAAGATTSRSHLGLGMLDEGGLLSALRQRHEVSLWRCDADAEPVALLPLTVAAEPEPAPAAATDELQTQWRESLAPIGVETRLGEALARVLEREPAGTLAGVVVITDGGNNAGIDPPAAAARLARAGVRIEAIGVGSETLPANVRVADILVPARVFPGDGFAVTAYLQAQGLEGQRVRVELRELPASDATPSATEQPTSGGRLVDTLDAMLAADGELAAIRFDVPGLRAPGSRTLVVRVVPPPEDRTPADDVAAAVIEVVDRVTNVLVMAGGPGREYQFMRNVLHRDASFEVDVLLGTASPGISQDARKIVDGFPPSDEALAAYDAIVAIDFDWQSLEPAAIPRLERWVARQAGGLFLVAGGIHMDAWLGDPGGSALRGLFPVELRRPGQVSVSGRGVEEPMPLEFTRDGSDAEFLWLAPTRDASQVIWSEFPGVYSCHPATEAKPGATVYARVAKPGATAGEPRQIYVAGQFYGAGSVLYAGSGELWRLRSVADGAYERLVAQLVRHVSQGRLAQGGRRAKLLVDRDRHPVGGTVQVRVVVADEALLAASAGRPPVCRAVGPDGEASVVPLVAEPDRPGTLVGSFVATREGSWRVEVEAMPGLGDERLERRLQVQLPDRELARPRLDRPLLEQLASITGGTATFPSSGAWKPSDSASLVEKLPDRSRREFETGVADMTFKRQLNTALLAIGCTCLCFEWILRRLAKLA